MYYGTEVRSQLVGPEDNLKQEETFYVPRDRNKVTTSRTRGQFETRRNILCPRDRSKVTTSKTRGQFEARENINFSAIKQNINRRKPINETVGDTQRALNNNAKKN